MSPLLHTGMHRALIDEHVDELMRRARDERAAALAGRQRRRPVAGLLRSILAAFLIR